MRAVAQFTITESYDSFTHIRYAMDSTGLGMTDKPSLWESSGRNLLFESDFPVDTEKWTFPNGISISTDVLFDGLNTVKMESSGTNRLTVPSQHYATYEAGRELVLRFYIMCPDTSKIKKNLFSYIAFRTDNYTFNGNVLREISISEFTAVGDGEWLEVSISGKSEDVTNIYCTFIIATNNVDATFYVASPKMEYGNTSTPWTPAPEDYLEDYIQPYIGICNSNSPIAPVDANSYTWSKFIGDDSYTHIRYASDINGSNMTDSPGLPLVTLYGETSQTGAGDPSPTNIRLLSGRNKYGTQNLPQTLYSLPNGVSDEFDSVTGIGVQRVGVAILDGSQVLSIFNTLTNTSEFRVSANNFKIKSSSTSALYSDMLKVETTWGKDIPYILYGSGGTTDYKQIVIRLPVLDVAAAKAILTANPITVLYELSEYIPIIGEPLQSQSQSYIGICISDSSTAPTDPSAYTWSKYTGDPGIDGKFVNITASSQVFKSVDGGLTFLPNNITLTPTFQGGLVYSKWQYSLDGSTWKDVSSGSNGLIVNTGTLIIDRTSNLFTSTITTITFKVISSNSNYFNTITILKLYDVTDIEIGGRNLLYNTNFSQPLDSTQYSVRGSAHQLSIVDNGWSGTKALKIVASTAGSSGNDFIMTTTIPIEPESSYIFSGWIKSESSLKMVVRFGYGNGNNSINVTNEWTKFSVRVLSGTQHGELIPYITSVGTVYLSNIKLERGYYATDWTPAPEDFDKQIISTNTKITNVSQTIDNVKKEVETKVTQTEIDKSITAIKPDIDRANLGVDKWLVQIYNKSSLPESNQELTDIEGLVGTGVIPDKTVNLEDKDIKLILPYGTNYIGYAMTFVYFTTDTSLNPTWDMSGNGTLLLNGKTITKSGDRVTLPFVQGWNIIEVIWNVSSPATSGGFKFGVLISTNVNCELMNCYNSTITSRETTLSTKYSGMKIDIDSITTSVSHIVSDLITKADGEVVQSLSEQLNESISTFESFKRTVSESYITNDYKTYVESSFEQLTNSISARITEDQLNSAMKLNANAWRLDFSENGAISGSTTIDKEGITVGGDSTSGYTTKITSQEFSGSFDGNKVFWFNREETVTERLRSIKGIDLQTIKIIPITQNNYGGLDFLGSSSIL